MGKRVLFGILIIMLLVAGCAHPPVETPTPLPAEEAKPPAETATPSEITTLGRITRDETWSGTVLITGEVWVDKGVTLMIQPGTIVKFKHWRPGYTEPSRRIGLNIEGTLRAIGTPEKPIRFTSDAPSPEHSDWKGINIGAPHIPMSNGNILDYCIVEFAKGCGVGADHVNFTLSNSIVRWCQGANVYFNHSSSIITRNRIYGAGHGGIEMANSSPTITYNTIRDNGASAIVPISTSKPTIQHNIIRDNQGMGILIMGLSSPSIEYNDITENSLGGIKIVKADSTIRYNNICNNKARQLLLEHVGDVTATNNWWGTVEEAEVDSGIEVYEGKVSYEPYLSSPVDIGEIKYDFENNETYAHPPATEKDTFPYFSPSDETRRIVTSWSTVPNPSGIAWDGQYLWVVTLNKRLLKYDTGGRLVDSLVPPGSLPIALAYDGQYLWSLDLSERLAYQFDFSGRVVKSIPAPTGGYGEGGLAYDGQHLLTLQEGKLYKFDTSGNIVEIIQIQMDWVVISGLAWDGEHLWAVDKDVNEKIFQIEPSSGSVLGWINPPGDETWGMVWVEGYLWACEWTNDWNNYLVVKMEPIAQPHSSD